jgi:hypothetical protein
MEQTIIVSSCRAQSQKVLQCEAKWVRQSRGRPEKHLIHDVMTYFSRLRDCLAEDLDLIDIHEVRTRRTEARRYLLRVWNRVTVEDVRTFKSPWVVCSVTDCTQQVSLDVRFQYSVDGTHHDHTISYRNDL